MKAFLIKFKELFFALVLALIISFMLFIVEPITLYANNINDFWFDLYTLIKPTFIMFLASFTVLSIFFIIIYLISLKIKKKNFFLIIFLVSIFCFICAYIHSNFLAGFLPPLDGTTFDWSDPAANTSSIITYVVIAATLIFCVIKLGLTKTVKYSFYTTLAVFVMLSVSLVSTMATTAALEPKEFTAVATSKNINTVSSQKNFMILLLDAVDSTHFNKVVRSNSEYQETFKDFSYFPDTLSGYAFTRDSIPFIFSAQWSENKVPFNVYSSEAFDNSSFFKELSNQNYFKNFYDSDFVWQSRKALDFDNIDSLGRDAEFTTFIKQEIKYILFKSLPFPLKRFSSIHTLNFNAAQQVSEDTEAFTWWDTNFYHTTLKQPITKIDGKYFQYIHLEGGHVPFDTNINVERISGEGTYEQKLEASMKIVEAYIERLKENNAYDNATIVVLADHGFWHEETSRVNPILYIKGVNETHDKMQVSEKQVSYVDLAQAFIELLSDKKSTEIFANIPTSGRTRRYLHNSFGKEYIMKEYETTDNAWKAESLKPTGREFNL